MTFNKRYMWEKKNNLSKNKIASFQIFVSKSVSNPSFIKTLYNTNS